MNAVTLRGCPSESESTPRIGSRNTLWSWNLHGMSLPKDDRLAAWVLFFGGMYAGDPCRARQQVACRQQAHCDTSRRRKKTQLCHIFSYLHCWSYDDCWWFSLLKINHSFCAIIFKTHRNAKCCCTRLWGSTISQFAPKPSLFLVELWLKLNKRWCR